ncbi:kinase-like domain-containing protein [Suillus bovinus]|uniref:kinase-like domain-containing protein n=1 Tax=Suillus bovinus TaxID=48563 RepID=UPI001B87D037|nr:kinase-like domain-containing protein [Suillus bovinus]KAG2128949.1 kinase-like domain-containing protein [Suillus bovinus]
MGCMRYAVYPEIDQVASGDRQSTTMHRMAWRWRWTVNANPSTITSKTILILEVAPHGLHLIYISLAPLTFSKLRYRDSASLGLHPPLLAVVRGSTLMASASTTECHIIPREQLTEVKKFPAAVGGYGQVFQCKMQQPGQPEEFVAVKVLRRVSKKVDLKHARREMKIWQTAIHENIVRMLGITDGFSEECFAMVSRWMEGGTLAQYLRDHEENIPCMKKLTLIKDVTFGLEYLHSHLIVHGDLTTNNVMLDDESGRALLIDFGLSNVLDGMAGSCYSLSAARPGAVRFAAPELFIVGEATSQPTGKSLAVDNVNESLLIMPNMPSDIYSLGCVMLNIFTEKLPWFTYRSNDLAIIGAHHAKKSMPIPSHSHLSKEREQFICKCASVQVCGRPSSQDAKAFIEKQILIEDTQAPIQQSMIEANRDIPSIVLHRLDTEIPNHIQEPVVDVVGYLHPQGDGNTPSISPVSSYATPLTSQPADSHDCVCSQTCNASNVAQPSPQVPNTSMPDGNESHVTLQPADSNDGASSRIHDVFTMTQLSPASENSSITDGSNPLVAPQAADPHDGASSQTCKTSTVAQPPLVLPNTPIPNGNDPPVLVSSPTRKCNVVIAGAVGSGKSSLVNLLSRKRVADTSIDAGRCTRESKDYPISFRDTAYRVFDTVGFAYSNGPSSVPEDRPKKWGKRQIGKISTQGSIDLILLCVTSRNFHVQAALDAHKKIQDELNGRKVPVVLVVTHFEEQPTSNRWWSENLSMFQSQLHSITEHTCISLSHDKYKYFEESRKHIFQIMAQYGTRASDARELLQESSGGDHSASHSRTLLDDVVRALHINQLSVQVREVVMKGFGLLPRSS